jgi:magnesium transporter
MVMLTKLLRFQVQDKRQRRARLSDLWVEWSGVEKMDRRHNLIRVDDLDAEEKQEDKDLLLSRDLMDALVLDLLGRRTTRICDLWLVEEEGALRLKGADAGLLALIRRVTRGMIGGARREALFDWKYVEFLRGDPKAVSNGAGYRLRINRLPAGEIARLADYVPYLHAAELLKLLPDEKAADVLQAMSIERQLQVIEELDENEAVNLLRRMSPNVATDLCGRLQIDTMRRYITKLPADRREKIIELLRYPENTVGGVMANDLVILPADLVAGEAQSQVQERIKNVDFISLVFLIDGERSQKLRGSISLRELLGADPKAKVEDLMDPYLETLNPFENAVGAAHKIVGSQLEAMPVTDEHGKLIGAMTIAAAIALLVPRFSQLRVFS